VDHDEVDAGAGVRVAGKAARQSANVTRSLQGRVQQLSR
jgi:hypothetical protein